MNGFNNTTTMSNETFYDNTTESGQSSIGSSGNGSQASGGFSMALPWDNPKNILTKDMADGITESLQCYVFPVVTLVGIIGSVMSLAVLFQKRLRKSTTSIILISLALSDALFLVTNMIRKSSCIVGRYNEELANEISATTFFYMFYLKTSFSRVSTLLVVLISVERLVAVAFPLNVKFLVTKSRMILGSVLCYILTFGSLAALPPQYTYTYIRGKPYISQTPFAKHNEEALNVYNSYFLPIVFRYIPVLAVLIINIIIVILIKGSDRFRKSNAKQDPKRKEEQRKITQMLLTVSIIYLVCLLPGDILLFVSTIVDDFQFFGAYHNLFTVLSDICLLFEMFNSTVNFIIYMLLNKNFFITFLELMRCGRDQTVYGETKSKSHETASTSATDPVKSKRGIEGDIITTVLNTGKVEYDNHAFTE